MVGLSAAKLSNHWYTRTLWTIVGRSLVIWGRDRHGQPLLGHDAALGAMVAAFPP
jgi:hypothetical protein